VRRILPALAAALACAACTAPIFDPTAMAAVATFNASSFIGSTASFRPPDFDSNGEPDFDIGQDIITYVPLRSAGGITFNAGFVVVRKRYDSWNRTYFQWFDGTGVSWLKTPGDFWADDRNPRVGPFSLKDGGWLGYLHQGSDTETWLDHLFVNMGGPSVYWDPDPSDPPPNHWQDIGMGVMGPLGLGSTPVVVGFSVNASASPTEDQAYALVRNGTLFYEARANLDATGFTMISPAITPGGYDFTFLDQPRELIYFRDEANTRSFVQWHDWDGWRAAAWRGTAGIGPEEIDDAVKLDHRIDAVLSQDAGPVPSSYLFSTEDQVGRVYRYDGIDTETMVAEFPLGTLRFIGEMYLDGAWQLVFSRLMLAGEYRYFEIRSLRTADIITTFGL
jgi:hypothetical protein